MSVFSYEIKQVYSHLPCKGVYQCEITITLPCDDTGCLLLEFQSPEVLALSQLDELWGGIHSTKQARSKSYLKHNQELMKLEESVKVEVEGVKLQILSIFRLNGASKFVCEKMNKEEVIILENH